MAAKVSKGAPKFSKAKMAQIKGRDVYKTGSGKDTFHGGSGSKKYSNTAGTPKKSLLDIKPKKGGGGGIHRDRKGRFT